MIWQYTDGMCDKEHISLDALTMDQLGLNRPGIITFTFIFSRTTARILHSIHNGTPTFSTINHHARDVEKNDPIFGYAVPQALQRDLINAEFHLLDTGHFALEKVVWI